MSFHQSQPWHAGEDAIHTLTGVGMREDNPTSPFLTPRAAHLVQRYPLLALGTLDALDRPWTTLWGTGEPPMAQAVAQSVLGVRAQVDARFDPVVEAIWKGRDDGEVVREDPAGKGRMVSGLSISLEERGRVKLFGRMVAGALSAKGEDGDVEEAGGGSESGKIGKTGEAQMVVKIEQSLGNCPKYLNKKKITSHTPRPKLLSDSPHLTEGAVELIARADLFFVSSSHEHEDMDTNHRGGPPGFVRVQQSDSGSEPSTLVWPEYSGNNLYQTLGNLIATPKAGLVIPSFETGDVLYLTGETEVLVGAAAAKMIAKTNLAVKFTITAARYVQDGLPFRGTPTDDATHGLSPYNPRVRHLMSEKSEQFANSTGEDAPTTAKLVKKTKITPTINRYRFALEDPAIFGPWKPGQYAALDFSGELDMGYSHMRDDDPTSLNDDYLRTFTVSSVPGSLGEHGEEFEVTVRKVGSVTSWLGWQREGMMEIGVRGFGGDFRFEMDGGRKIGFIAAGIGITPLLGQMGSPDVGRIQVLWSVGIRDVGLVLDVLKQYPTLRERTVVFLTGAESALDEQADRNQLKQVLELGVRIQRRRMQEGDLSKVQDQIDDWYLCTAPAMRKQVQEWLPGKSIIFENFDY